LELAEEIEKRAASAGIVQPVLLEVNLGEEPTKAGFTPGELAAAPVVEALDRMPSLAIRGLMAVPPAAVPAEAARPYFRRLRELAAEIAGRRLSRIRMVELSMGMTQDFPIAVEEGATLVRVGTAIFGPRPTSG
ncbi:MAG: alanine racemase, partial [Nitrospirales bacterium]